MANIDLQYFWNQAVTYSEYKEIITREAEEGKDSADEKVKKMAGYTQLNLSRIQRNDKTLIIDDAIQTSIKNLNKKINFLVISEGWCGDASQVVPVVNMIAKESENIEMRIVFRDKDERLINQYLTNGGKSIPIVIILDENYKEIAHWGPRPEPCTPLLKKYKADPENYTHDDFAKDIQNFYNTDKGYTISLELIKLF